jgi:succinate dehydrogenase / fumarate reductase, flavoprotein subunit
MSVAHYDVLVVGAGLAGHIAALEAARRGLRVALLAKSQPFETHSAIPEGGINLTLAAESDWRPQADDIWNDGHFLSDWDALEAACRDGPQLIHTEFFDLLERDAGSAVVVHDSAGTRWRVKAGRYTGISLLRRLYSALADHGVHLLMDRVLTSLVVDAGKCVGVTALNVLTGEVEGYAAATVVLCTGGFGHLYQNTAHAGGMSGDGQAQAYLAGVALKDMEFVRFHHMILYGSNYAITEGAFRKDMRLYNKHGERFIAKYDSTAMEGAETYFLKRYLQLELDAGLAVEDKYFYADFTHLGEERIDRELPRTRRGCLEALNLDLVHDRLPVVPGVFATLGGIETDVHGRTGLPGLYAAGECACPGLHGADWRLGNTLLAALVFGARAGVSAASDRATPGAPSRSPAVESAVDRETSRLQGIAEREGGEPYHLVRGALRRTMSRDVTVIRDRPRLENALATIRRLQRQYQQAVLWDPGMRFNQQLLEFLQLGNMLLLAEAVASAALARTESRGSHVRGDYPERDDAGWLRHSIQRHSPDGPRLAHVPVRLGEFRPRETVLIR